MNNDFNVEQELVNQYRAQKQKQESLTDRLNKFDEYRQKIMPVMTEEFTGTRPVGYNPTTSTGKLINYISDIMGERSAIEEGLAGAGTQATDVLYKLNQIAEQSKNQYNLLEQLDLKNKLAKEGYKLTGFDNSGQPIVEPMTEDDLINNIGLTGTNKTKAATLIGLGRAVKQMEGKYNTKYTGLAQGAYQQARSGLGMPSTGFEDYQSSLADVTNSMLAYISGSQIAESEAERLMKQIPKLTDSNKKAESKIRALNAYILNNMTGILGSENANIDPNIYLNKKTGYTFNAPNQQLKGSTTKNTIETEKEADNYIKNYKY